MDNMEFVPASGHRHRHKRRQVRSVSLKDTDRFTLHFGNGFKLPIDSHKTRNLSDQNSGL